MQTAHFVIPDPSAVPAGLKRAKEIKDLLLNGHYKIDHNFVEARSLACVACIILEEVSNDSE